MKTFQILEFILSLLFSFAYFTYLLLMIQLFIANDTIIYPKHSELNFVADIDCGWVKETVSISITKKQK